MKKKTHKKIIITNKFIKHMEVHRNSFIVPYTKLIDICNNDGTFQNLTKSLEAFVVEFPYNIGFSEMVEINGDEEVFYAKRIGRSIYTKFVVGKQNKEVNKCVICLKQNQANNKEYFLITMFPGEYTVREPEDTTIKDITTLKATLKFWQNHALKFDLETVDTSTIVKECPYKHSMLIKINQLKLQN
ncbi:hypothetical protein [Clostridium hydrogenum]|uniref:hypothetical protein n=1 Tax=Clostridium hydrogenum TaxID=2855764 RepID=UPI001F418C50|nr:hypothetical protein [Clostridium hydrogenum]